MLVEADAEQDDGGRDGPSRADDLEGPARAWRKSKSGGASERLREDERQGASERNSPRRRPSESQAMAMAVTTVTPAVERRRAAPVSKLSREGAKEWAS